MSERPEIGATAAANGIKTNYLAAGRGDPVVLIHGSGPGVTAYANWRLVLPALGQRFRAIAPDMVGFGFTERLHRVEVPDAPARLAGAAGLGGRARLRPSIRANTERNVPTGARPRRAGGSTGGSARQRLVS
jgi:pimeloyl-ACP methyl ester carboxylesterase